MNSNLAVWPEAPAVDCFLDEASYTALALGQALVEERDSDLLAAHAVAEGVVIYPKKRLVSFVLRPSCPSTVLPHLQEHAAARGFHYSCSVMVTWRGIEMPWPVAKGYLVLSREQYPAVACDCLQKTCT